MNVYRVKNILWKTDKFFAWFFLLTRKILFPNYITLSENKSKYIEIIVIVQNKYNQFSKRYEYFAQKEIGIV